MERRNLIRLLVGLGIGIPVLVEGLTFLGLLNQRFGGGADEPTGTPPPRTVGIGDELLPETPATETVRDMVIRAGEGWRFVMRVRVENDGDRPVELRLDAVTLADGSVVTGGGATGVVSPGDTGTVTGQWDLPEGATPQAVRVIAVTQGGDGTTPKSIAREVRLAKVPVEGA